MVQHVREGMRVAWLCLHWLHRHTRGCLLLLTLGAASSTSTSAFAAATTVTVTAPATRRLQ